MVGENYAARDGELLLEEVLVVRVHPELLQYQRLPGLTLPPNKAFWKRRYQAINLRSLLYGEPGRGAMPVREHVRVLSARVCAHVRLFSYGSLNDIKHNANAKLAPLRLLLENSVLRRKVNIVAAV